MDQQLANFYLTKPEPMASCFLALRSIILGKSPSFSETLKYGMPCFLFNGKIACYLWLDKKTNEPYVLFSDGKLLLFPELETGTRAKMKILRFTVNEDIPIKLLNAILTQVMANFQALR